jgi:uncharacterized protein YdaU (DUF1376 family)
MQSGVFFFGGVAMPNKDPAFLFYPWDWLGGTMGMSFEEKGAYLELLVFQFNNHSFTEKQAKHMLSTCSADAWHNIKHKFKAEGGNFYNERLRLEMARRKKYTESRRINALGGKDKEEGSPFR